MRSRVHMLQIAAARLEQDGGNKLLIEHLREAAKEASGFKAQNKGAKAELEEEEKRIGGRRTLMAMVPDSRAKDTLISGMLQRAYDLMWDGRCTECDAILDFLPSKEVERMFDAWERDQEGKEPRSTFYEGSQ